MNAVLVLACVAVMGAVLAWTDNDQRIARSDHAARQRLLTELERASRR